ncbi:hypothetical protein PInf_010186 [Phytophthora infestans]|nr:hypothetical protein PInf_010186 [Phytophthora infestans]
MADDDGESRWEAAQVVTYLAGAKHDKRSGRRSVTSASSSTGGNRATTSEANDTWDGRDRRRRENREYRDGNTRFARVERQCRRQYGKKDE